MTNYLKGNQQNRNKKHQHTQQTENIKCNYENIKFPTKVK